MSVHCTAKAFRAKCVHLLNKISAMHEDIHFQLLQLLQQNPTISQRALATELGISLGKVNYCLRALVDKGWVKVNNFRKSERKGAYLYQLTPQGIAQKAKLTVQFLRRKEAEHQRLMEEIEQLRKMVAELEATSE